MTRNLQVIEYLLENPNATNQEIAQHLNVTDSFIAKVISTLKKNEVIEVEKDMNGERTILVNSERIPSRVVRPKATGLKQEALELSLVKMMEVLVSDTRVENQVNAVTLIIKLTDRL